MHTVKRTDDEIDNLLNECVETEEESKFPGMTYEQGIQMAIRWLIGEEETNPMED